MNSKAVFRPFFGGCLDHNLENISKNLKSDSHDQWDKWYFDNGGALWRLETQIH